MRIYEDRERNKKQRYCRICGHLGHMWFTCPAPAKMMELRKQGKDPDKTLLSYALRRELSLWPNGKLEQEQYLWAVMENAYEEQQKRASSRKNKQKKKQKSRCGFCNSASHNRRTCETMENFKQDLSRSNQNFRSMFHKLIVQDLGLAEGALVSVQAMQIHLGSEWIENFQSVGIVSKIHWSEVNLSLAMSCWDYHSKLTIEMIIENQTFSTKSPFGILSQEDSSTGRCIADIFGNGTSEWGLQIDAILAPSKAIPSKEWFNEGYEDCWDWIAKKKSLPLLNNWFSPMIDHWHPKTGEFAEGLKERLRSYGYDK